MSWGCGWASSGSALALGMSEWFLFIFLVFALSSDALA